MKRIFVDAPAGLRCEAVVTLKDKTTANCGRYKKIGCYCKQHAKKEGK